MVDDYDTLADLLRDRYESRKGSTDKARAITVTEAAHRAGISQGHLSKLLKGYGDFKGMLPWKLYKLLQEFDFEDEAYDIALRFELQELQKWIEWQRPATHGDESSQAAYLGLLQSGLGRNDIGAAEMTRSVPNEIAKRHNVSDLFVVRVNDESLTCTKVKDEIPPGSEVYFHSRMTPRRGDIVAVWLSEYQTGALKVYDPDDGYAVLESYDRKAAPIVLTGDVEQVIRGVCIGKFISKERVTEAVGGSR